MKHRVCLLALLTVAWAAAWGASAGVAAEVRPSLSAEAAKVAKDFLFAFSRNDRDAISTMLPKKLHERYGPSPFSRMPVLSKPRADSRMGVVEFRGGRPEGGMPERGIMVLRRMTEGKRTIWRVRQIYWYDELPPDARLPEKSPTPADKKQEPAVLEAAKEFIHTWMVGSFDKLDAQVFHWWEVDRPAPKWVKMTGVDLRRPSESLGGLRVSFTAKLRLVGALPKSVDGTLWLVQEEGAWRVRPLTVALFF